MEYDRAFRKWAEERFARAGMEEEGRQLGLRMANAAFFASPDQSVPEIEDVRASILSLAAKMFALLGKGVQIADSDEVRNEWELLHFVALALPRVTE